GCRSDSLCPDDGEAFCAGGASPGTTSNSLITTAILILQNSEMVKAQFKLGFFRFMSISCPGCKWRGSSMLFAAAIDCQSSPLPWLAAIPGSVEPADACVSLFVPGDDGPPLGFVSRKANLVILCCDRLSVMLARSG